jgi:membrane-bound metal-dependent hydrolase YbcI (DUF457 family)
MANFQTHFNVAAFVSAVGAGTVYYSGLVDKPEATMLFAGGIIGGILPDIDSDNSTPTRIMQYIFANLISFFVLFKYIGVYPIGNLILIWIGSFMVSMGLFYFFNKITSHRGMFHSIPAGFIFWFSFSLLFYYVFKFNYLISWYFGMFVFLGYLVHLILDEIYSVDITGAKMKKSFGTALKLWNKDIKSVAIFYLFAILLFTAMPYKKAFYNSFTKFDIITTYHKLLRKYKR